jgi:hypothetical protein
MFNLTASKVTMHVKISDRARVILSYKETAYKIVSAIINNKRSLEKGEPVPVDEQSNRPGKGHKGHFVLRSVTSMEKDGNSLTKK